jgi:hypothetical protein
MFRRLIFKTKKFLFKGVVLASHIARHVLNFALSQEAKSIPLERQRRALATTVDYVERHMRHVDSVGSKNELLTKAFKYADVSGNRLICEFGVFMGASINYIAKMTTRTIYGFDSFEGLPERWWDGLKMGAFAVPKPPKVRRNVLLVKGLFHNSLPGFLKEHTGPIGFLHVDSDLYSSSLNCLNRVSNRARSLYLTSISITPNGRKVNTRRSWNSWTRPASHSSLSAITATRNRWPSSCG